jgi:hypothetical protein
MHSTEIGIRGEKVRGVTLFLARRSGAARVAFAPSWAEFCLALTVLSFCLAAWGKSPFSTDPSPPINVRLVRYSTDFSYRYTWTRFTALEMKLPRPD